jgi:hypothetical protein
MRGKKNLALLVGGTASLLGGAIVVVLPHDESGAHVAIPPARDERAHQPPLAGPRFDSPERQPVDRFAFVAPDALPLRLSSLVEEDYPEEDPEWSAEVQAEPGPALDGWKLSVSPATPRNPTGNAAGGQPPQRRMTLAERLGAISPGATKRLSEKFEAAKIAWPPSEIAMIALKDEKILELYARLPSLEWKLVHRYPVLAASGGTGPKLRQGDKQVPEGIYRIIFLNPQSRYHVSLRVNYPNAFDRQMAAKDGRKDLGGDIMIHGKALSAGCLAVGDEAAEELFVLAAEVGLPNVKLIIAPTDFRRQPPAPAQIAGQPDWLPLLYAEVATAMAEFKRPAPTGLLSFLQN